jgi:hypothetical protein
LRRHLPLRRLGHGGERVILLRGVVLADESMWLHVTASDTHCKKHIQL